MTGIKKLIKKYQVMLYVFSSAICFLPGVCSSEVFSPSNNSSIMNSTTYSEDADRNATTIIPVTYSIGNDTFLSETSLSPNEIGLIAFGVIAGIFAVVLLFCINPSYQEQQNEVLRCSKYHLKTWVFLLVCVFF